MSGDVVVGPGLVLASLVLLAATTAVATAPAPPPSSGTAPVAVDEVERTLADELEDSGIPGGAVAVVSPGRVEAAGAGSADEGRAVTADTPFVIGSASKSFTALAVLQLVDAGAVDLDTPARELVPELALARGEPVDEITVRHLLQQTSGLDDLRGGPLLASASDGTALEAVAELRDARLVSPPGTSWRYANANYVLAGLVVERASGLDYDEYVEQEIFAPLGMTHSSADTDPVGDDVLAPGHQPWFGVGIADEPLRREATLAAGYLISTAEDLGRYLSLYLSDGRASDGTRVVSAAGLRTMLAPGPGAHLGAWAQGRESRYAMGWFVGGPWGEDAVFHPGNTPDTTTMLAVLPEQDVAVAAVVDAGNELPVPGNPFVADRVTRNVVHAAVGQPTQDLPPRWRFYLVFDLVVLLLVGAATWGLLRAARRLRSRSAPRHPVLDWGGVLVGAGGAGLLLLAPAATYGWRGLWTWAPDLAVVLGVLAVLLVLTAGLRGAALVRGRTA